LDSFERAWAGQSEEGRAKLKEWEEEAHRRLEQAENLPPERWSEVWGVDD
jgi:hypothetical protein